MHVAEEVCRSGPPGVQSSIWSQREPQSNYLQVVLVGDGPTGNKCGRSDSSHGFAYTTFIPGPDCDSMGRS